MAKPLMIVADVHGKFTAFNRIIRDNADKQVLQLGDLGIGFPNKEKLLFTPDSPAWWAFFGNHDCRDLMEQLPCWIGPYGLLPGYEDIFFVGGARSVDQQHRTEGVDWWRNEELSLVEAYDCLKDYQAAKPRVVISHDAPISLQSMLFEADPRGNPVLRFGPQPESRTGLLLQAMLEAHRPETWIFGHWHMSWTQHIEGVQFRCLRELETCLLAAE